MFRANEFRAELARRGISISEAAKIMGISYTALYHKMKGNSDFFRNEIEAIKDSLTLSNDDVVRIFFA